MRDSAPTHFASVQLLRFVAATMVVLMHTTEAMADRMPALRDLAAWTPGGAGVDIFFVISGFVMAVSSRPPSPDSAVNLANAIDFFKRRLLRVVPLYWFYTLLKIAAVLALPALALRTTLDPAHILASFLFIPWTSPWGLIQPVMPVGWTLNFEMLFYAIFAAAIALNVNRLAFCLGAFCLLHAAGLVLPDLAAPAFYGRTLLFEFGIGLLVAELYRHRLAMLPALLMLCAGIALIAHESAVFDRLFFQGLGAGLLVLGGIHLERNAAVRAALSRLSVLGDISYSSYLCHSFLVPVAVVLLARAQLQEPAVVILITLLAVVAGSFASHFWIERPLTERLKASLFASARTSAAPSPRPRMENP